MKKLMGLLAILSVVLYSCGLGNTTTKCEAKKGESSYTSKITSKDDIALKASQVIITDLEESGMTKSEASEMGEEMVEYYDYDGIEFDYKVDSKKFTIELEIDFKEVSGEDLETITYGAFEAGEEVTLDDMIDLYKDEGLSCEEN